MDSIMLFSTRMFCSIAVRRFIITATAGMLLLLTGSCSSPSAELPVEQPIQPAAQTQQQELNDDGQSVYWWETIDEPADVKQGLQPPETVDRAQVMPHTGEALMRARMKLDDFIDRLNRPSYLPDDDQLETTEENQLPVEAMYAYVAGRAAWYLDPRSDEARRELERANRLAPNQPEILSLLGESFAASGNMVRAANYLKKAIKLDPSDVTSLRLMGRYMMAQGRWEEAAATFDYALGLRDTVDSTPDPVLWPMMQYQLGNTLVHLGYDLAAIEQYAQYLETFERFASITRLYRERSFLYRQRAATWQDVGDALNRLGRPKAAMTAYEKAASLRISDTQALVNRIAYTRLLLGEEDQLLSQIAALLESGESDQLVFSLIRYLSDSNVDITSLNTKMQAVYSRRGQSATLALAIADLLDKQQAVELLEGHLEQHPTDRTVYERLIEMLLTAEGDQQTNIDKAVRQTVRIIREHQAVRQRYIELLISKTGDDQSLLASLDRELAMGIADRTMLLLIRAMLLAGSSDTQAAVEAFEQVIKADADLQIARLELAQLLIDQKSYDLAGEVLKPLADESDPGVVVMRTRLTLAGGDNNKAMQLIEQGLDHFPKSLDLLLLKGDLHWQTGNLKLAERAYLDALYAFPRIEQVYIKLFNLYETGELENWQSQWNWLERRAWQTITFTRTAKIKHARMLMQQRKFDQAGSILEMLLAENKDDYLVIRLLLTVYQSSDRAEDAEKLLEKSLERSADDPNMLAVAVNWYHNLDDPRWMEFEEKRILLDKPSMERDLKLALLYEMQERHADVVKVLNNALKRQELDQPTAVLYTLGKALVALEDADQLDASYQAAIQRFDDQAGQLYFQWGVQSLDLQRATQAVDLINKALEKGVSNPPQAVAYLTRALKAAGQEDRIDELMKPLIQRYEDQQADIIFQWATFIDRQGDKPRAEQMMEDLLKKYPAHAMTNNTLGYVWVNSDRNLVRARAMIKRAVDTDPENAAYLDSLGWAEYKLGNFTEAYRWLRQAVQNGGGDYPVILDHLGDTAYRLDQKARASRYWNQALQRWPEEDIESDPELVGLDQRLQAKISAANNDKPVNVATSPGHDKQKDQEQSPEAENQIQLPPVQMPQPGR